MKKAPLLDRLIEENPNKPIIELSQWEIDSARMFLKDTHMGCYKYRDRVFLVKKT